MIGEVVQISWQVNEQTLHLRFSHAVSIWIWFVQLIRLRIIFLLTKRKSINVCKRKLDNIIFQDYHWQTIVNWLILMILEGVDSEIITVYF